MYMIESRLGLLVLSAIFILVLALSLSEGPELSMKDACAAVYGEYHVNIYGIKPEKGRIKLEASGLDNSAIVKIEFHLDTGLGAQQEPLALHANGICKNGLVSAIFPGVRVDNQNAVVTGAAFHGIFHSDLIEDSFGKVELGLVDPYSGQKNRASFLFSEYSSSW